MKADDLAGQEKSSTFAAGQADGPIGFLVAVGQDWSCRVPEITALKGEVFGTDEGRLAVAVWAVERDDFGHGGLRCWSGLTSPGTVSVVSRLRVVRSTRGPFRVSLVRRRACRGGN